MVQEGSQYTCTTNTCLQTHAMKQTHLHTPVDLNGVVAVFNGNTVADATCAVSPAARLDSGETAPPAVPAAPVPAAPAPPMPAPPAPAAVRPTPPDGLRLITLPAPPAVACGGWEVVLGCLPSADGCACPVCVVCVCVCRCTSMYNHKRTITHTYHFLHCQHVAQTSF